MTREVDLLVNGQGYRGWQTVRVTRSIESIAGSFDLGVTERWHNQAAPWPIAEGDACVIRIGGAAVLTGYIDDRKLSFGPEEHSVSVSGRDKAGDLVDCSAVPGAWEFKSISVLKFVEKICAPFGISVTLQPGLLPPPVLKKIAVGVGDSAFHAIEHACRFAGLLPVSDGRGGIVLTRAGTEVCTTALVQGKNIKTARATFQHAARFHKYVVHAQNRGSDEDWGERVTSVTGTALDTDVKRTERVLLIRPEGGANAAQAKTRAEWEASVRASRAEQVSITVSGWTQENGELWPLNKLVSVDAPNVGIKSARLISTVTYAYSPSAGTTTTLDLAPPSAFAPAPTVTTVDGRWPEIAKGV